MLIYIEVTLDINGQIYASVFANLLQHVVEEA